MIFVRSLLQIAKFSEKATGLVIPEDVLRSKIHENKYKEILDEINDRGGYLFPGFNNSNTLQLLIDYTDISWRGLARATDIEFDLLMKMRKHEHVLYKDVMKILEYRSIDPVTYLMYKEAI